MCVNTSNINIIQEFKIRAIMDALCYVRNDTIRQALDISTVEIIYRIGPMS